MRRRTDFGANWSTTPAGADPCWIAADPNDPQRIYASCADGVYQSTNGMIIRMTGSPSETTRLTVDSSSRVFAVKWRKSGGGLYRFATNRWTLLRSDQYIRAKARW